MILLRKSVSPILSLQFGLDAKIQSLHIGLGLHKIVFFDSKPISDVTLGVSYSGTFQTKTLPVLEFCELSSAVQAQSSFGTDSSPFDILKFL
jgi:hypothetical protein